MASRATIEFNFNQANRQADRLDELAGRLKNVSDRDLQSVMQEVSGAWQSENASAYLNKGSALQGKMNTTARNLNTIASEIRTVAKNIYDAEMEALRIAEQRAYNQSQSRKKR